MNNQKRITSNLIWRFLERMGAQGVTFVVSIVLARLLDPDVYGTVALVTVFTSIMQVFVDSGMGNALIQKKNADDVDFSSVFYFNMVACTVLYIIMFLSAPFIASFYGKTELIPLIRVMSLTLIISGIKNIQQAYVSRNLLFKKFFFSTIGGTIGAAFLGVWMAWRGFGVWSLVAQNLLNQIVDTCILWVTVKWRPRLCFSFSRLKALFKYGWKLLVSSLIDAGYRDIRQLIIGKQYSSEDLAFYNRGEQFPKLLVVNINISIDSVLLPTMSEQQDDRNRVLMMTRRAIKTSTYLMMPLMVGLAVCASPVIRLVLTEKWLPAVSYLRIFCFTSAFYPVNTANLSAIKAIGRSDLFLKLEIIKKVIGMIALLSTMFISVQAMAYSLLFTAVISQLVNAWPNKKLLGYGYFDQLKDMLPQTLLSFLMGGLIYCLSLFGFSDLFTLLLQIPLGVAFYIGISKIIHMESYDYIVTIAKNYLKRS